MTGGGAVLYANSTDHTGPILAFVGAILVALLTAYTADRRQRAALDAEDERQRTALNAEAQRLRARLDHERSMEDVRDLRRVVTDVLNDFDDLALTQIKMHELLKEDEPDEDEKAALELVVAEKLDCVIRATNGLQVRLSDDDVILNAHPRLYRAYVKQRKAIDDRDDAGFEAASDEAAAAYRDIVEAAKARCASFTPV